MRRDLEDKVVLTTGGGRGIGEATAKALRSRRTRVVIGDIDKEAGKATAHRLGRVVHPAGCAYPGSFGEFVRQGESQVGPLDVLVNNAGIMPVGPILDADETTAR